MARTRSPRAQAAAPTLPTLSALSRVGPLLREFPDGYEARVVREGAPGHAHDQLWILLNPAGWTVVTDRATKGESRRK